MLVSTLSSYLLLVIVFAVGGFSSTAHADEEAEGTDATESRDKYPNEFILRPLTLPKGMAQVSLGAGYFWIDDRPNLVSGSTSTTFGITDWWDASVGTGFRLKPDADWSKLATFSSKVLVYDSARIDFAPGLSVTTDFDTAGDSHPIPAVSLNATSRMYITKDYSLICGNGLVQLGIGRRASLDLNCSLLIQGPHKRFGFRMSVDILTLPLHGDVGESSAFIPRALSLLYTVGNWIDFSAGYTVGGGYYSGAFGRITLRHK